jgi:hypothetical protein
MIGGLAKASTSLLRQLIDAGTLANLPAGFKARGMRIRDEDEPLQPGEFRDIDTTGASLKENLIPLPIKEPSTVLMTLLGTLVESGKRFAAIADTNVADMNQAMPVGTTVALLERGTKVMSAIHKRLHHSQIRVSTACASVCRILTASLSVPPRSGSGRFQGGRL